MKAEREEYEHYLDMLDDDADSQDQELATRLGRAATPAPEGERESFRDYLHQRTSPSDEALSSTGTPK